MRETRARLRNVLFVVVDFDGWDDNDCDENDSVGFHRYAFARQNFRGCSFNNDRGGGVRLLVADLRYRVSNAVLDLRQCVFERVRQTCGGRWTAASVASMTRDVEACANDT